MAHPPSACIDPATRGPAASTAGAAWVRRYLEPLLLARSPQLPGALRCLQLAADDDEEASALRRLGHACTVFMPLEAPAGSIAWRVPPVIGSPAPPLPFEDAAFDLVFSSAFGRLAPTPAARVALARELCRLVRPGGALLLSVGNRRCPLDLQGRNSLLHGPFHDETATLGELERAFTQAGSSRVERLGLEGQFGWRRARGLLRPMVGLATRYLRAVADPRRRWLYASPFNPLLVLYITR